MIDRTGILDFLTDQLHDPRDPHRTQQGHSFIISWNIFDLNCGRFGVSTLLHTTIYDRIMFQSDEIFQPDPTLGDAGEIGPSLRLSLLRHLGELIRDLTCDTEVRLHGPAPVGPDAPEASLDEAEPAGAAFEVIALSDYGDEAALHAVRMEALQVFETRPLRQEAVVVVWVDAVHLWGRPLVLCTAATMEGYHRILGFAEASLQDLAAMQQLFQDLLDRGLCVKRGLLCVTPGTAALSPILTECLGPQVRLQYCQMHKRERVISYLSEADRLRIRGAITRAFALPEAAQAHTALMQIHAELKHSNRSAAQWLLQDLEQTLTVHRSGLAQKLSSSLRSTRCIVRVAQHLNQRLRGVRHWLPPDSRRAQIALLLLETDANKSNGWPGFVSNCKVPVLTRTVT